MIYSPKNGAFFMPTGEVNIRAKMLMGLRMELQMGLQKPIKTRL